MSKYNSGWKASNNEKMKNGYDFLWTSNDKASGVWSKITNTKEIDKNCGTSDRVTVWQMTWSTHNQRRVIT